MRINHVIKTGQWRAAPKIRPAPHFAMSLLDLSLTALGDIFREYSRQSTATTHYFPSKFITESKEESCYFP